MKITMYELLGMVKDDKEPKKVKYRNEVLYYDDETKNYFNDEDVNPLFAEVNTVLDDEVEILEEEKKIPEKLQGSCDMTTSEICRMNNIEVKINEIIDYLDYLKSKGE